MGLVIMSLIRISLEQWQTFVAVVKEGGYLNASQMLNKTQPSITYSIQKIEQLLGITLFEIQGRKSVLTKQGKDLYEYASQLVRLASDIEKKAQGKINKIEYQICLAIDEIFPIQKLMPVLDEFSVQHPESTVVIKRGILSGPCDLLEREEADIAITFKHPKHIIAEEFYTTSSALYASSRHRLSLLDRTLNQSDLVIDRQIIVMDDNQKQALDFGWLNPTNAWYVDSLEMKFHLINDGLGYGWLNEEYVASQTNDLVKLNCETGNVRHHQLFLAYRSWEALGVGGRAMMDLLHSGRE